MFSGDFKEAHAKVVDIPENDLVNAQILGLYFDVLHKSSTLWLRDAIKLIQLYRVAEMYKTDRVMYISRKALEKEFERDFMSYLVKSQDSDDSDSGNFKKSNEDNKGNSTEEGQDDVGEQSLARLTEIVDLIYDATGPVTKALAPILVKACGSHWGELERDHSRAFEQLRLSNVDFCNDLLKGCLNHINGDDDDVQG